MLFSTTLTHSEAWGMEKLLAIKYCWYKSKGYISLFIELLVLHFLSPLAKIKLSPGF